MNQSKKRSWIEDLAVRVGWLKDTAPIPESATTSLPLVSAPPPEKWDDWVEIEPRGWPGQRVEKHYQLIPTTCFNCESACGLLAYVDKETHTIRKFEGNPLHPASRGRLCAKGPATINQINDPDRILFPLRRVGARGEGKWEKITWPDAVNLVAARIRRALEENRKNEIVYHVGRPGHEGYVDRVLQAWGIDGHNSHTNICSSGARFGYAIWHGYDRPSPDHANAEFILLISAHLESGHYFNPHAQRIIEGKLSGAKLAVMDPRLSNTASMADYWMPTRPGTEAIALLAMARILLEEKLFDAEFLKRWVAWEEYLRHKQPNGDLTFESFISSLKAEYARYTPEYAEAECGIPAKTIVEVAIRIGRAGHRFAAHNWRGPASAHIGGWQVARCLHFLSVLVGAVGTEGGTSPNAWQKFKPSFFDVPPPQDVWNELHFPPEYPLGHYEMSFLLPHFLKEGRGKLDVYFTRVFNPVWTYPDGFSWVEMLRDETKVGLHVALTPTWNETAYWADLVLPMGQASERHDLNSYETHSAQWIAFRQPVLRVAKERAGQPVQHTYEANPGEVWEEDEFWIELSWQIDPAGQLGIRKHFESPNRPGEKITIDEYYRYIFERVPGLPEAAKAKGLDPLSYMKRFGAFEVQKNTYLRHERMLGKEEATGVEVDPVSKIALKAGKALGIEQDGRCIEGFPTPSRKQELYSQTLADWGWPEYALPGYIPSQVDWHELNIEAGEFCLLPTFRLPTLIHTRSGAAKWLNEIAQCNPLWLHPSDGRRIGLADGDLAKVQTEIGYFIDRVWLTEAIRPGVAACSHHLGRWRRPQDTPGNRYSANLVEITQPEPGKYRVRQIHGPNPFVSADPDSSRIWWREGGVPQNLTFPVQPDPISGMHCWHQKVTICQVGREDCYGDVFVDTNRSHEVYKRWLAKTRGGPGPEGLRRPLWLNRPLRPTLAAFYVDSVPKSA
ncbi:MAG: molybdopterin-dependent oxidoreductase [Planctomycetes bacterium]|nr:molybdopterin-dependent oxidoreductase [Planctomycetota bacterium]